MLQKFYTEGDEKIVSDYIAKLTVLSDEKLKEKEETAAHQRLLVVRRQALYLIALITVLRQRFDSSLIQEEGNVIKLRLK